MEQQEFEERIKPRTWILAQKQGYGRYLDMWIDKDWMARFKQVQDALPKLISTESEQLRDFFEEGPWDDVWEAEFFGALVELTPDAEDLHEVAPGTYATVVSLAMNGAAVVKTDSDGTIEDPPRVGTPCVLFFADAETLERVRQVADECDMRLVREDRELWCIKGTSLRAFPTFAAKLSTGR